MDLLQVIGMLFVKVETSCRIYKGTAGSSNPGAQRFFCGPLKALMKEKKLADIISEILSRKYDHLP